MWQRCIIFPSANHISDEQWDKEQERVREKRRRNLRNFSAEILERSQGKRRRENFNENQRNGAHRWFSWLSIGLSYGRLRIQTLAGSTLKILR